MAEPFIERYQICPRTAPATFLPHVAKMRKQLVPYGLIFDSIEIGSVPVTQVGRLDYAKLVRRSPKEMEREAPEVGELRVQT